MLTLIRSMLLTLTLVSAAYSEPAEPPTTVEGISAPKFYEKLYAEIDGAPREQRYLFNTKPEDWPRIEGKGSDRAKLSLRIARDGNYEALYTEISDLKQSTEGQIQKQSYSVDFEETLKGKWHLEHDKLVFEDLGTAKGIATKDTKHPGLTLEFSKNIHSQGLKGKKITIYVVRSSGSTLK